MRAASPPETLIRRSGFFLAIAILMPSPAKSSEDAARTLEHDLRRTVAFLSQEIGPRSLEQPEKLDRAGDRLLEQFRALGYEVSVQTYAADGRAVRNLIAERRGSLRP